MSIQAVFFDAVGTLLTAQPSVAEAYCIAGRKHGSQLDEQQIAQGFTQSVSRRFCEDLPEVGSDGTTPSQHRTSSSWEVQRWRNIVADVFVDVPDREKLFEDLWNHFAAPESWRLYDDVANCWESLESDGVQLGIASNFDDRLPSICAAERPISRCEHVFYSSQLGFRKPSLQFFRTITERLQLLPAELLYVGDDLDADYYAATGAGWNAIWLNRLSKEASPQIPTIRSLNELSVFLNDI